MKHFYILLHDFNSNKPIKYDIMPYLLQTYKECKEKGYWWPLDNSEKYPTTLADFKEFIEHACRHQYWARCQYEFLMLPWPYGDIDTLEKAQKVIHQASKIDGFEQIEMNIDTVVAVFIDNITNKS